MTKKQVLAWLDEGEKSFRRYAIDENDADIAKYYLEEADMYSDVYQKILNSQR